MIRKFRKNKKTSENKVQKSQKGSVVFKIILSISLLIIFTCVTIGLFAFNKASVSLNKLITLTMTNRATDIAKMASEEVEDYIFKVESIAERTEIKSMDWETQKNILSAEQERLGFIDAAIIDVDGNAMFMKGHSGNLGDREYFQRALSGTTNVTDPFFSDIENQLIIASASPIKNENKQIVGVLAILYDGKALSNIVKDIKVGLTGYAYIINSKSTVIAHPEIEMVKEQYNVLEEAKKDDELKQLGEVTEKIVKGEQGIGEHKFRGQHKFVSYAPVPGTDWSLVLEQPKDEIFADIDMLRKNILLITVVFIALGLAISAYLSRMIKVPLNKIKEYTEKLAQGDLATRAELKSNDEFGQMASSLNIAVENIGKIIDETQKIAVKSETASDAILAST